MIVVDTRLLVGLTACAAVIVTYLGYKKFQSKHGGNVGNGQARHTPAVNPAVNAAVYKSDSKVDLTFDTLEGAINHNNPQLKILLQFLLEKSPFKDKQEMMKVSGCLDRIDRILFETSDKHIRILCLKIFTNISTNPAMLKDHIKPLVPFLYDIMSDERCDPDVLAQVLALLVNITSHNDIIMADYNLKIPEILSRYTVQINLHYDIVLFSLKILVNMTCAKLKFDQTLVYMSAVHILLGCRNNAIILRVLTLIRNILTSDYLVHDANFDDELLRGTATVLSRCEDTSCLELANQIYRLISEKKSGIRNRAVEIGLISEKGC